MWYRCGVVAQVVLYAQEYIAPCCKTFNLKDFSRNHKTKHLVKMLAEQISLRIVETYSRIYDKA